MTNHEIENLVSKLKIKHFRGVFMKDELPKTPEKIECGIINLENSYQVGSHWTCYFKKADQKYYFDSFGDAKPPRELVKYLGKDNLFYNKDRIQDFDDPPICGHLCLIVLEKISEGCAFENIINFFF